MDDTYPTWMKVASGHWETLEQMDGTPDYIAIRTISEGWWLKWRSSAKATVGFANISQVKAFVAQQEREMREQVTQ